MTPRDQDPILAARAEVFESLAGPNVGWNVHILSEERQETVLLGSYSLVRITSPLSL